MCLTGSLTQTYLHIVYILVVCRHKVIMPREINSTRPVFRKWQFEHSESQRMWCQCDIMMLWCCIELGVCIMMLWHHMETGVCKHKKDVTDTSNSWLTTLLTATFYIYIFYCSIIINLNNFGGFLNLQPKYIY